MNRHPIAQRLIWKSVRQSVPLVASLTVLVAVQMFITSTIIRGYHWDVLSQLLMLVPILFSAGTGATLVSFDRDSKALDWLKSLPSRWKTIVFTPIVVSATILGLLWCVMLGIAWIGNLTSGGGMANMFGPHLSYFVAHSFYLLVCGFASAWFFRAPLPSLLGIVPLASIPALIEVARQQWVRWWSDEPNVRYIPDLPMPLAIGLLGLCGLTLLVVIGLLGRRELRPQSQRASSRLMSSGRQIFSQVARLDESFEGDSQRRNCPMSRRSTLQWGFYHENRNIFRAGQLSVFAFAYATYIVVTQTSSEFARGVAGIAQFLSGVILLSIPVLTFQADSNRDRVRFLTERGIRPRELWWSRQVVVLGIVSLFVFVVGTVMLLSHPVIFNKHSRGPSTGLLLVLVLHAYALSQWIGQVIPRVTLAVFFSLIGVAFSSAWILEKDHAIWSIIACNVVMFFATYRMMRPWMERRLDWHYYLGHVKYVAPIVTLLIAPAVYNFAQLQFWYDIRVAKVWNQDWYLEASTLQYEDPPTSDITVGHRFPNTEDWENREFLKIVDRQERVDAKLAILKGEPSFDMERLYEDLSSKVTADGAFRFTSEASHLIGCIDRLKFEATLSNDDQRKNSVDLYRRWVPLMVRLTSGLRRSHELDSQELADHYEVWLIKQCLQSDSQRMINAETFDAICELVSDKRRRWQSRRKALLSTWWKQHRSGSSLSWSALTRTTTQKPWTSRELVVGTLLSYIDAELRGDGHFPAEELTDILDKEPEHFGIGPGADWVRIADAREHGFDLGALAPVATLWGAEWETQGEQLRELASREASLSQETNR